MNERFIPKEKEQFVTKRLIVKIGSSTITEDGDPLNRDFMDNIAVQVSELLRGGVEVAIVSSGAVACGRKILGDIGATTLDNQVAAVYGQPALIAQWTIAFSKHGINVGQELLTDQNLKSSKLVLEKSLKRGVVIINANDAVNDEEMKQFAISADNDKLAGYVADLINADTLILLTDVDGVLDEGGKVMETIVSNENAEIVFRDKSAVGTGGMESKVEIAKEIANSGKIAFIANGKTPNVLLRIARGETLGTRIRKI